MFVNQNYTKEISLNLKVPSSDNIKSEIVNTHKNAIMEYGIIEEVEVLNNPLYVQINPSKNYNITTPIAIKATIFSVPSGFILPNCVVSNISNIDGNIKMRFTCDLFNIENSHIESSLMLCPVITSSGKSAESIKKYSNISQGDMLNLICLNPLIMNNYKQFLLNCDIAPIIKPIIFRHTNNLDLSNLKFTDNFIKDLYEIPKSAKVKDYKINNTYALAISGIYEVSDMEDEQIDFLIEKTITESNSSNAKYNIAGIDALQFYLEKHLENWLFVASNNNLQKDSILNLARIY